MNQVRAVQTRMEIDLRIGASLTRFQTMNLRRTVPQLREQTIISYGPCQFPTLGFVVDQYKRVSNFTPEPFWYISLEAKMPRSFIDYQISVAEKGPSPKTKSRAKKPKDTLAFKWSRNHLFDRMAVTVIFDKCCSGAGSEVARVAKVDNKPATTYRPLPLNTVEFQKLAQDLLEA